MRGHAEESVSAFPVSIQVNYIDGIDTSFTQCVERVPLGSVNNARIVEGLLAPKPLLPPPTQLRDAAAASASPSTEEPMSQQIRARGNDRDQHQLLEGLRCNSIAYMLSE